MNMRDTCYGCKDRQVGCHGKCERYLSAKAEMDAYNARVREGRAEEDDLVALKNRRIQKAKKRKRRYGHGKHSY